MTDLYVAPRLFGLEQAQLTSDDYYTPAWIFEQMDIEFDLDVCSPCGGLPWIPAKRYFTQADDGLVQPWEGRVWMNPPYSRPTPWIRRFIDHGNGVCLIPAAKARWFFELWAKADAFSVTPERFRFANGDAIAFGIFYAAFGDECVKAISRLGVVRIVLGKA